MKTSSEIQADINRLHGKFELFDKQEAKIRTNRSALRQKLGVLHSRLRRAQALEKDAHLLRARFVGSHPRKRDWSADKEVYVDTDYVIESVTAKQIRIRVAGDDRTQLFKLDGTPVRGWDSMRIDIQATFGTNEVTPAVWRKLCPVLVTTN